MPPGVRTVLMGGQLREVQLGSPADICDRIKGGSVPLAGPMPGSSADAFAHRDLPPSMVVANGQQVMRGSPADIFWNGPR